MTGGTDRASTVRALVRRGEYSVTKTALQDFRVTAEGETILISTEHVQESFKAVTETVLLRPSKNSRVKQLLSITVGPNHSKVYQRLQQLEKNENLS
jgi:hypothetical protein